MQITEPSSKKHQEYLTKNVEYLRMKKANVEITQRISSAKPSENFFNENFYSIRNRRFTLTLLAHFYAF